MKKSILTLGLIALISISAASCSTDDSAFENDTTANGIGTSNPGFIDNGDKELPKPPMKP